MSIKEKREAAGMDQKTLAKAAGVSCVSICRYETGKRTPDVDVAQKIARALNCTLDDLLRPE